MTGGKSGYKGYTYQALAFLNELLSKNSIYGELEKGDDFLIKKDGGNMICYQTKDYSTPLGSSDVKKFIPNFISAYKDGARKFKIISPFGMIKKIDLNKIFEDLFKLGKISKKDFLIKNEIISLITTKKNSRSEIEAELKIKIGDIIKGDGGSILSDETVDICMKILGEFYKDQKKVNKSLILEKIKKYGSSFSVHPSKKSLTNSSDLIEKYLQEKFEKKLSESAVHFLVKFYFKRKRLAQNPSLLNKFTKFYFLILDKIKAKKLIILRFKDYKILVKRVLSDEKDQELEIFVEGDASILREMYNNMI